MRSANDSTSKHHRVAVLLAVAAGLIGCDGYLVVSGSDSEGPASGRSSNGSSVAAEQTDRGDDESVHDDATPPQMNRPAAVGVGGLKRLTRLEYDNTLEQLFGPPLGEDKPFGEQFLPGTSPKPFSNDFVRQDPSDYLVERLKRAAEKAAARVVDELKSSEAARRYVLGCQPSGADDAECFRTFLKTFVRRAHRRPVGSEKLQELMDRFFELAALRETARQTGNDRLVEAVDGATFYDKARLAIEGILQSPSFIYRREAGEKASSPSGDETAVWKLSNYAMASRLSYFLWGGPPDETLLEAAARGELETAAQVREQADRMLDTRRARERMFHFHAAWLNFQDFWLGRNDREVPAEQADAMRAETRKLLDRVLFEEGASWLKLFRAERTWIEPELAEFYEFVDPGEVAGVSEDEEGAWIRYPDESLRRGILSHGTFLTNGRRQNGETHIIRRSEVILHRLMCQSIPPPPDDAPMNVDEADGADGAECKVEKLDAATLVDGCESCHYKLNKLGGALENFDNRGRFRRYRSDQRDCKIEGRGGLYESTSEGWTETVSFRGPGGLSETLVDEYDVAGCMVKHLYEFALGHTDLSKGDRGAIRQLRRSFERSDYDFRELVLELVSADAFRYRRVSSEDGDTEQ